MKAAFKKWLKWFCCDHEWRQHSQFGHSIKMQDGEEIDRGISYVKECTKCGRLWSQRVP